MSDPQRGRGRQATRKQLGAWYTPPELVAAVVQSVRTIEIIPEFLLDAHIQMADLLVRMWPPDTAYYPKQIHGALMETLHIASLGTLLSIVMAVPLALLVAGNLTRNKAVNLLARIALVTSRSVNSLVWALLFVAVFGPGPLAGTLAIAACSENGNGKKAEPPAVPVAARASPISAAAM